MCIICDKPAGVDMPSEDDIKYMFTHNPNGAGFAVQGWFEHIETNKKTGLERVVKRFEVHYQKGFMNVDDLIEALGQPERLKDKRVVIHCRITTSGNSDRPTTHPFPLSSNYGDLRKTEGDGPVLFHNGIFSGLGGIVDKKSSDTQDFVIGVANRMLSVPNHISKISKKIAEKIAGECRVLILYPNPNHPDFRLGTWHDHDGCKYSNTNYRGYYSGYSSGNTLGKPVSRWTDYDDDYYGGYYGYGYGGPDDDDDPMEAVQRLLEKKDSGHDFDEWGCNHATYAMPEKYCNWIDLKTAGRVQIIKQQATRSTVNQQGIRQYYFRYNPNIAWVIDEKNLDMYTAEGYKMILAKEENLAETEEEELNRMWSDNVMFMDEFEMEEFLETCRQLSVGLYEFNGKYWYLDEENYVAYTEKGLALMFKPGEIGHVRNAILRDGYDSYSAERQATQQAAKQISKEDMKETFKQLQLEYGGKNENNA